MPFSPSRTPLSMNAISLIVLAFAMSTDAFAAAISKGAALHKPRLPEALRTGCLLYTSPSPRDS